MMVLRPRRGRRILEGYRPPYDATAVQKLEGGWRGAVGQTELRRVCHGLGRMRTRPRASAQPGGHGAGSGRLERRLGGGGGGQPGGGHAGLRHRGLDSPASQLLRRGGPVLPTYGRVSRYGTDCFCLIAGSSRPVCRQCARRCHTTGCDCRPHPKTQPVLRLRFRITPLRVTSPPQDCASAFPPSILAEEASIRRCAQAIEKGINALKAGRLYSQAVVDCRTPQYARSDDT